MKLILSLLMASSIASANIIAPPPAPPSLTTAQHQAQTKAQIQVSVNALYRNIKTGFATVFNLVWNNPNLTSQQVFDAFATDAGQLFVIAGNIQAAMNNIIPGTLPQAPPNAYTINSDGTVTVGAPVGP